MRAHWTILGALLLALGAAQAAGAANPAEGAVRRTVDQVAQAERSAKDPVTRQELQGIGALLRSERAGEAPKDLLSKASEALGRLEKLQTGVVGDARLRTRLAAAALQLHQAVHILQPFELPAILADGRTNGTLALGKSTLDQTRKLYPPDGAGRRVQPERSSLTATAGGKRIQTRHLLRPDSARCELYFNAQRILVMVVEGTAYGTMDRHALLRRYPRARETRRGADWYELQADLGGCVTLVAVLHAGRETVDSITYAFTCFSHESLVRVGN
jgi:hypothetical protein